MRKNTNIKILIIVFCFSGLLGCSTKKKTWVHRQYHNITAKYNGYFNAKESLKTGVKKITEKHIDDYTSMLSIYKTGDLKKATATHIYMDKAIKKASVVIQRHSIRIKGKEYCRWIDDSYFLIGKAYFYKGNFEEAIKTFNFIKNEYKKTPIRFDAALWLIRSYSEKQDFISAEIELIELEKIRRKPKKIKEELIIVEADFYLKQGNYSLALEKLEEAISKIKRKKNKSRIHYICGQILQEHNSFSRATKHYQQALKGAIDYEMAFNSKMHIARFSENNRKENNKIEERLLKMIKDEKNKEYLGQIYFTLGEIKMTQEDTIEAVKNYNLSTKNSEGNYSQKTLSFLALAEIKLKQEQFILAKEKYDSVVYYIKKEHKKYLEIKNTHIKLTELTHHLQTILYEDSVQTLAGLPENELQIVINTIIQREIEKEREKRNLQLEKQQNTFKGSRYEQENEQFGNRSSGGNWYFYNPATLSFGLSEFRKKWGKRKLEDDWRRQDKTSNTEIDSTEVKEETKKTTNKKDPTYYINSLPKTKQEKEESDKKIKESYYQSGVIYREDFAKHKKSTTQFLKLLKRFPSEEEYIPKTLYNMFLNYTHENNIQKTKQIKKEIIEKFPQSVYSKLIQNEKYVDEQKEKEQKEKEQYQKTYSKYKEKKYKEIISITTQIKEGSYKEKYKYIRAISFLKINDTIGFKKEMLELTKQEKDTIISKQAEILLSILEDPSKMIKTNKEALNKTPYTDSEKTRHNIIMLLPKKTIDINYFKAVISDFNQQRFSTQIFEIKAFLLGTENHLILIKSFENKREAKNYYTTFLYNETIMKELQKTEHKVFLISDENFTYFYKNKDIEGYTDFFKKKYMD